MFDLRIARTALASRWLLRAAFGDWLRPATRGHTIGHEIAMPMAGFKVQPP